MHEYAITESMIDIAVEEAEKAGGRSIMSIKLIIGDLSSIMDESVQMYFDIISNGTLAEGAKLEFKRVRAALKCKACGYEFDKPDRGFECPLCGDTGSLTGKGSEFYIESIEIE